MTANDREGRASRLPGSNLSSQFGGEPGAEAHELPLEVQPGSPAEPHQEPQARSRARTPAASLGSSSLGLGEKQDLRPACCRRSGGPNRTGLRTHWAPAKGPNPGHPHFQELPHNATREQCWGREGPAEVGPTHGHSCGGRLQRAARGRAQAQDPRPTSGATKRPRQLTRLTGPSSRAAGEGGAERWGSWVPLKHRHLFKGRRKDL